ncbi:hypothetical protein Msil_1432 [Methylocella silvestris BL2]|uniref:Uncharacterized protein n=1 Tax=Methylocella silvestris (strain DSM 15510 / CIP 108128 / LMG 27833 / NCIMB 13906 / BL2) TaxID=395965 RepID=B8ESR1_METSB|nr:hypothetical protein [Methylocella silvestris]ACK50396.1 hypothetical protein Msil_1432 [Methylocella silvestris BL2]
MNKIGAAVLFGLVACALPAAAAEVAARAALTETDDVTGAINKGAAQGGVSGGASTSAASVSSYQQAFRNWRDCVATHQGGANPPPMCEPLRADLRRAMSERSRNEAAR